MTALQKLKARVLKAEIATRNAKNPSHVFDLADVYTDVDETGEIIVTDAAGTKVEGKSLTEFLDEMPKVRPDLFTVETTVTAGNPFARGPSYNVTEQMRLMRTSPDTARRLEAEAYKKA
jgi:hypothetical protein